MWQELIAIWRLSQTVTAKSAYKGEHKLMNIQTQETRCILVCQIYLQEIVGKPGCRERLISVLSCAEKWPTLHKIDLLDKLGISRKDVVFLFTNAVWSQQLKHKLQNLEGAEHKAHTKYSTRWNYKNSVALVPDRPSLVGYVSANFCG
jgi:hypothetical protein